MIQKNRLKVQSSRLRQASINNSSRNSDRSKYGEMIMRNSSGFDENNMSLQQKQQNQQQNAIENSYSQQSSMYDVNKLMGELGQCFDTKEPEKKKLREILQQSRELQQENRQEKRQMEKDEKTFQKKMKKKKQKETPFLTGVEIEEKKKAAPKEEQIEDYQIDDQDVLDNLKELEGIKVDDDLADLKKMIYHAKKNISSYAGELYSLNNQVKEVNSQQARLGYMGSTDELDRVYKKFNKYMPEGKHEKLFSYDHKYDYDYRNDPSIQKANSVAILDTIDMSKHKQHRQLK